MRLNVIGLYCFVQEKVKDTMAWQHKEYYFSTLLFCYQIMTLHKCKQELSNMNKCLLWERVKTFSLPDL